MYIYMYKYKYIFKINTVTGVKSNIVPNHYITYTHEEYSVLT